VFIVMDECDALPTENCNLKDECDELKKEVQESEQENKIIKDEKIELHMDNLVLHNNVEKVKETLRIKEENFVANLKKLEKESLNLKQKIESLLAENQNLHENLKQIAQEQAVNKRWLDSSNALNWLNTHHNRGRKGQGFVKKHTIYPCNRKYVGLPENIVCYHCGRTGHVRYVCPSREHAFKNNFGYVKQI